MIIDYGNPSLLHVPYQCQYTIYQLLRVYGCGSPAELNQPLFGTLLSIRSSCATPPVTQTARRWDRGKQWRCCLATGRHGNKRQIPVNLSLYHQDCSPVAHPETESYTSRINAYNRRPWPLAITCGVVTLALLFRTLSIMMSAAMDSMSSPARRRAHKHAQGDMSVRTEDVYTGGTEDPCPLSCQVKQPTHPSAAPISLMIDSSDHECRHDFEVDTGIVDWDGPDDRTIHTTGRPGIKSPMEPF